MLWFIGISSIIEIDNLDPMKSRESGFSSILLNKENSIFIIKFLMPRFLF